MKIWVSCAWGGGVGWIPGECADWGHVRAGLGTQQDSTEWRSCGGRAEAGAGRGEAGGGGRGSWGANGPTVESDSRPLRQTLNYS